MFLKRNGSRSHAVVDQKLNVKVKLMSSERKKQVTLKEDRIKVILRKVDHNNVMVEKYTNSKQFSAVEVLCKENTRLVKEKRTLQEEVEVLKKVQKKSEVMQNVMKKKAQRKVNHLDPYSVQ